MKEETTRTPVPSTRTSFSPFNDKSKISYPALSFRPDQFFALGSPLGAVFVMRSTNPIEYPLLEGLHLYNLYDLFDPIAYRIEPLLNPVFKNLPPFIVPPCPGKGGGGGGYWWSSRDMGGMSLLDGIGIPSFGEIGIGPALGGIGAGFSNLPSLSSLTFPFMGSMVDYLYGTEVSLDSNKDNQKEEEKPYADPGVTGKRKRNSFSQEPPQEPPQKRVSSRLKRKQFKAQMKQLYTPRVEISLEDSMFSASLPKPIPEFHKEGDEGSLMTITSKSKSFPEKVGFTEPLVSQLPLTYNSTPTFNLLPNIPFPLHISLESQSQSSPQKSYSTIQNKSPNHFVPPCSFISRKEKPEMNSGHLTSNPVPSSLISASSSNLNLQIQKKESSLPFPSSFKNTDLTLKQPEKVSELMKSSLVLVSSETTETPLNFDDEKGVPNSAFLRDALVTVGSSVGNVVGAVKDAWGSWRVTGEDEPPEIEGRNSKPSLFQNSVPFSSGKTIAKGTLGVQGLESGKLTTESLPDESLTLKREDLERPKLDPQSVFYSSVPSNSISPSNLIITPNVSPISPPPCCSLSPNDQIQKTESPPWSNLPQSQRLDFCLQDPSLASSGTSWQQYVWASRSHFSYWGNRDMMNFILKRSWGKFKNLPNPPSIPSEWKSLGSFESSKCHSTKEDSKITSQDLNKSSDPS